MSTIPTGAYASSEDVPAYIGFLKGHLAVLPAFVNGLSGDRLLERPAPDKWSRKEILGHLVDSAVNNLIRFTRAPLSAPPYQMLGYPQVELVQINHYQEVPIGHLLTLWEGLNRQILFVVEELGAEQLALPVQRADGATFTLGWLFSDYVAHLEHHLAQIYKR